MCFKKLFLLFCLFSTFIIHAAPKELPTPPPSPMEQALPAEPTAQEQAAPPPAPLPSSIEMTDSYEGAFVKMLVMLAGLIFLVVATFWILRRLGKGKFSMGSGRAINVIEKRALSPKTMLYVIEVGNKKIMIAESQFEVRTLTSFEEEPEV